MFKNTLMADGVTHLTAEDVKAFKENQRKSFKAFCKTNTLQAGAKLKLPKGGKV